MDPRLRGPVASARTSGSSQSPDATRTSSPDAAGEPAPPDRPRPSRALSQRGPPAPARRSGRRGRAPARRGRRPPGSGSARRCRNGRSRKTATQGAQRIPRCRPEGSAGASAPACGRSRRRPGRPSRTRSTDSTRSGTARRADQQQVDDQQRRRQQPARPADRREQRVGQRGAHRAARVGRVGDWPARRLARRIGRVIAGQAQCQEHDREAEPDERSGSQGRWRNDMQPPAARAWDEVPARTGRKPPVPGGDTARGLPRPTAAPVPSGPPDIS